ncbi:restriction endonuclease subunit S [Streptococcus infantis]|uniref:restriction endonuclease subunit S n=1 Tax=Streptococcus infantis TaxID=68892 RepID=UPI0039C4606B
MKQSNPRIRFKEFNNKWGNYKLGQLGTFKSGIGFSDSQQGGTEGIPFFKVSDMNNIGNETEMRNANNYVTQEQIMKNSWKVINETPAIIFAKVGAALMLNRKRLVTRPFLIDNNTMSYSFDELWDKDFGLTLFQTINLPKYAQIGALPSYNASDIAMIKVNVPDVQEQSAIGSLFRTLDDLLTNYKDNLANYQSLKASMLSKMFPKAGQTVPEIRLDGFEGEWETKILSEVTNITMGQSPKSENYTDNPNDYILVQGNADIKGNQVVPRLWTTEVTKMAEIGDIILTVRAPVGDIGKTDYNVVIGRGVAAIKGNDFIFYTLEKMKMTGFWNRFSTGSTFESISSNDIKEAIIQIPTLKEQQAIGAYFSNLDNLISAHKEKISQLETLKKKLLQDMFI